MIGNKEQRAYFNEIERCRMRLIRKIHESRDEQFTFPAHFMPEDEEAIATILGELLSAGYTYQFMSDCYAIYPPVKYNYW